MKRRSSKLLRPLNFALLLLLTKGLSFAQTLEIKGLVIDSTTSTPIAYASVGIKKLGIGTITNQEGNFTLKLPAPSMNQNVEIQFLGYKTYSLPVKSFKIKQTCRLAASPKEIREVIVIPEDTLRNLLRLAFRAIPKNYPTKPTMYTGFYREVQKANDTLFLNFTEAILEVYKKTYTDNPNFGQIRVVKSRKNNFPGLDTINNVRFYGGPFMPNVLDFVFSRSGFINPKQFKNYHYWVIDTKKMDDNDVYCIGFESTNDSIRGVLYLEKQSLAYIGADIQKKGKSRSLLKVYEHGNANKKIGYIKYKDKWHLAYTTFSSTGLNTALNKCVYHNDEYITTSIRTDSVKPIPYETEFAPLDIISIKAEDYTKTSWKDFNVLQESNSLEAQIPNAYSNDDASEILAKKYPEKKNKREQFFAIVSHFSFDYNLGYLPFGSNGGLYQVNYTDKNGMSLNHNGTVKAFDYSLTLNTQTNYFFNKHWGVFISSIYALSAKQTYNSWSLGLQYFTPLSRHSRKWFASGGVAYNNARYNLDLGTANNKNINLLINNKRFEASKVNVFLGKWSYGITPNVSVIYKLSRFIGLSLNASYLVEFSSSDRISFKESSGFFLTRKRESIPVSDGRLQFSIDNASKTESNLTIKPYQVALGLHVSFL